MQAMFLASWIVGVVAILFAMRFLMVARYAKVKPPGTMKRALISIGIFLLAFVVAGAAAFIAERWGGGMP
jgi:hypothetical protein